MRRDRASVRLAKYWERRSQPLLPRCSSGRCEERDDTPGPGGIHFEDGDFEAHKAGDLAGQQVWTKTYFTGKATATT